MTKLSVIVPVWGVEKYVGKCARSIFASTMTDMQVIFVNDYTPDRSMEIIKDVLNEFPNRKDNVIFVEHESNRGLPQARKTGLNYADGEFIAYCDSDDWVEPDMYEKMYNYACFNGLDLVQCDHMWLSDNAILHKTSYPVKKSHCYRYDILTRKISNAVWNKIVKKSLLDKNFYFPQAQMDEDDVFSVQVAYYAQRVGYLHECLYNHYQNPDSMTMIPNIEKKLKGFTEAKINSEWIVRFLSEKNEEELDEAIFIAKKCVKNYITTQLMPLGNYTQLWKDTYPEINWLLVYGRYSSFFSRIKNLIVNLGIYPVSLRILEYIKSNN